jgi:hypothetical protein
MQTTEEFRKVLQEESIFKRYGNIQKLSNQFELVSLEETKLSLKRDLTENTQNASKGTG